MTITVLEIVQKLAVRYLSNTLWLQYAIDYIIIPLKENQFFVATE